MTIQFTVAFPSLLVEDQDLVTFYQFAYYFTYYFCTFNRGYTYGDSAVFVNQQDAVKFYCCTVLSFLHVVHEQFLASLCFELLALDFYNCVHFFVLYRKLGPSGGLLIT